MQMGQLATLGIIGIFVAKNQHLRVKRPVVLELQNVSRPTP